MTEHTANTVSYAERARRAKRARRVRRIKRMIIGTCITLLVLPTILCIFLVFRVASLEDKVEQLRVRQEQTGGQLVPENKIEQSGKGESGTPEPTEAPRKKRVYLTFDDGPGEQTEKILDILKENDVKASFFVNGKEDPASQKIYKRIVKEGHTLGLHSYSHIYEEIYDSQKAFKKDFDKIYQWIEKTTGIKPEWYRFPGGSSTQNTDLPMDTFIEVLDKKNVQYMDWNVISPDISDQSVTKDGIVESIDESVAQFDTSVVLMYDSVERKMTVKALPLLIKKLKKENYDLLPIDSDTPLIQHNH